MKKPLPIAILSYVASQPPEKFPIQEFTIEDADGTESECIRQIAELEAAGLLSAAIWRDNMGRPAKAAIRGMTIEGRAHLATWEAETIQANPIRKAGRWTRDMVMVAIGAILMGLFPKVSEYLWRFLERFLPQP
jgi:hypothetical protein